MERIFGLEPFIFDSSRLLILGSMPSVQSLKAGFYYAHPQNRLWKIISSLANCQNFHAIDERKLAAKSLHLAFFDVIASCERQGSLDSAIKNPIPNDLSRLLDEFSNIRFIVTNGGLAKKLFLKYSADALRDREIKVYHLPSTSPANAAYSLEKLESIYLPVLRQALT